MHVFKNRWLRVFTGSFIIGAIVPLLLALGLSTYLHFSTVAQLPLHGTTMALVTNPFIEITDPGSGKVIASGRAALAVVVVLCGTVAGVLGMGVAAIMRRV